MSLIQDILKLSTRERLALIEQIWKSIPEADKSLPASHEEELEHRLEKLKNDKGGFFTWEEVKTMLNHDESI